MWLKIKVCMSVCPWWCFWNSLSPYTKRIVSWRQLTNSPFSDFIYLMTMTLNSLRVKNAVVWNRSRQVINPGCRKWVRASISPSPTPESARGIVNPVVRIPTGRALSAKRRAKECSAASHAISRKDITVGAKKLTSPLYASAAAELLHLSFRYWQIYTCAVVYRQPALQCVLCVRLCVSWSKCARALLSAEQFHSAARSSFSEGKSAATLCVLLQSAHLPCMYIRERGACESTINCCCFLRSRLHFYFCLLLPTLSVRAALGCEWVQRPDSTFWKTHLAFRIYA